ncbi:MAG: pyridoxamine 5'-phosphate oxidase family protein [Elusimicrobiota bacterium]|jgi:uncharacterized pyridoxamine 5'-phosphate oxidase family protein|nr:pyridoxamine 5'-phosphate oxidase family protein [Elusimicrobiota bacterium]
MNYEEVLKKNPNGVLATQDGNKVATRVFQYLFTEGGKVYFCTSNDKPVYKQLQANPYASFCTYAPDFAPVLSVNGRAVFVEDLALKTRALDENPAIKAIYGGADNAAFKLFYIEPEALQTFTFAEGAKTIKP